MADTFHVNGPAVLSFGAQGTAGALTQLGISEDGADVAPQYHDEPIMTDAGGSRVPEDLQDMGQDAFITFRLVKYDRAALRLLRRHRGGSGDGIQAGRGVPIFQAGLGFRLVIASSLDEPWRFFRCTLRNISRARLGTRRTAWDLTVYALPYLNGAGWLLYDHTAA